MKLDKVKSIMLFICITACILILFNTNINRTVTSTKNIIYSDIQVYYSYLPATFIEKDPFFERANTYDSLGLYWLEQTPIGRGVPKTSMGVAIIEMPFFLLANTIAHWTEENPNGFSKTYQLAISISSLVYALIGLYFLFIFLKRRFSTRASLLSVFLILFGTNLYFYSVYETGMSHPYSFFLLSSLLLLVDNWLIKKKITSSLFIGVVIGLIVLVRPVNILFLLPLVFIFKHTDSSWKLFGKQLFTPFLYLSLIILGGIISWLPQVIFWKIQTGSLFFFSYPGERFFWDNPHIVDGLFSFRKGWFIYTPLALFSLFGLFQLYKTKRSLFWAILVFLPLFIYVTFSWWCWWYGGGFSARSLVDILPFMTFPLAALLEWVFAKKWRMTFLIFPIFFVYLNVFQSWQYYMGFLHYDSLTWSSYKKVFLKKYTPVEYWELLEEPDYDRAKKYGK